MAKQWTLEEDQFIHAYFDGVGDFIGPHDLDRPKGSVAKRATFLKSSGAWAALDKCDAAWNEFLICTGRPPDPFSWR